VNNKCINCEYGAKMMEFRGTMYNFKQAIKKDKIINYDKGEMGCRMDQWNDKEKECLYSNFSQFKEKIL